MLLQHGEQLRDFQLETLLTGRFGAADLRLDRRNLGLQIGQTETRNETVKM